MHKVFLSSLFLFSCKLLQILFISTTLVVSNVSKIVTYEFPAAK